MKSPNEIKVWDAFVRSFHWIAVIAFVVCYATEGKPRWVHTNFGYTIAVLVVLRTLWGFVGPKYARFGDFVRAPGEVLAHLKDVAAFRAKRYLGHDPAGGAMIVALLLMLALTTTSGMLLYGAKDKAGPFAGWTAGIGQEWQQTGTVAFASRGDNEREHGRSEDPGEEGEDWLEEAHELMANVTLALALIHICGVLVVSYETRENLIGSMISGRKKQLD